jgi:hypothetical protein
MPLVFRAMKRGTSVALVFFEHAARLNPDDDNYAAAYLSAAKATDLPTALPPTAESVQHIAGRAAGNVI